jgi:hypothetical protein
VELYFTARRLPAESIFLDVYIQETNKPRKKLLTTRPQSSEGQVWQFPESLVIEYYFESTINSTQSAKKYQLRSFRRKDNGWA